MKDLHDDIGPTLAEIDAALLTQCMHITTASRHDMRKALTGFVAARHAAADLAMGFKGRAPVAADKGNGPSLDYASRHRYPAATRDSHENRIQAQTAADLTDAEIFHAARHIGSIYTGIPSEDIVNFAREVLSAQKAKNETP